jgi:hypothetical protein
MRPLAGGGPGTLTGMTTPSPTDGPLLLTGADVLQRVQQLARRARPERRNGLVTVLRGIGEDLVTAQGPGSVILTLERLGSDAVLPADRAWADGLAVACT